ncbi:MAG: Ca2+-binding RTX toxin-like protein, partial [Planctomycetota bacterium]
SRNLRIDGDAGDALGFGLGWQQTSDITIDGELYQQYTQDSLLLQVNAKLLTNVNFIRGTPENDILSGTFGEDTIIGDAGNDILNGAAENDNLRGGSGNDDLAGNDGDDVLKGGSGNDTLSGSEGDDTLKGNKDNDYLIGGEGDDNLNGGSGNDVLLGGAGNDILKGGAGDDVFIYDSLDQKIEGDTGIDTLRLIASGENLDLTQIRDNVIIEFEIIDLTGTGDNSLKLDLWEVAALAGSVNTALRVDGNLGDSINIGSGWIQSSDITIGEQLYITFEQHLEGTDTTAKLMVDADIIIA